MKMEKLLSLKKIIKMKIKSTIKIKKLIKQNNNKGNKINNKKN